MTEYVFEFDIPVEYREARTRFGGELTIKTESPVECMCILKYKLNGQEVCQVGEKLEVPQDFKEISSGVTERDLKKAYENGGYGNGPTLRKMVEAEQKYVKKGDYYALKFSDKEYSKIKEFPTTKKNLKEAFQENIGVFCLGYCNNHGRLTAQTLSGSTGIPEGHLQIDYSYGVNLQMQAFSDAVVAEN